jgi:hypothetical protein
MFGPLQQFATVVGIQASPAARVEQVVGAGYPQQEMPGEVDPDQRNLEAMRQFQCDQRQCQRLTALGVQHTMQQRRLRAQRQEIILCETEIDHAPQQRLRQFADRQHRQPIADA